MTVWHATLDEHCRRIEGSSTGERFSEALRHGSMTAELYAPLKVDLQGIHTQDELYLVVSGSGTFVKEGERQGFSAGDIIFVEAGAEHRFVEFTDDFTTWVVFWGPQGGEQS